MTSTRTKPATRRTTNRRRPAPARRPPWLWIALGIAVTLAAVVAVVASGGSDPTSSVAGVEETRDVEVTGTALAPLGAAPDPAVGQSAPVVHGASFDGTPVTVGGRGRATVIVFVAHWCPHCQREVPLLRDHLEDRPMASGVELVSVATSTTPDRPNYPPSAWLDREGWPGPVLADAPDGMAGRAFGLTVFPYFVAVDADGEVVARTSGEISTEQFDRLASLALGAGSP